MKLTLKFNPLSLFMIDPDRYFDKLFTLSKTFGKFLFDTLPH